MAILALKPSYEFDDLESRWNLLLSNSFDNNPFLTYEWITSWWKHFGKGRELKIFTSENAGNVSIVAPIMYSKHKVFGSTRYRASFVGAPDSSSMSDYNVFLISNFQEAARAANSLVENIVAESCVDQLVLTEVPEESVTNNILAGIKRRNFEVSRSAINECPYVPLPDNQEAFLYNIGHNMRRNLKVWQRQALKDHKVEFVSYRNFGNLKESMKIFFELHQKSQVSKGNFGEFSSEASKSFHLDLANAFDDKGWLALFFLTFDDEPVSCVYSFKYNGKLYAYLCGFDPEYARYHPGHLAFKNVMEYGIRKGLRELDFLRGDEEYKSRWNPMVRKNLKFRLTKKGLKNRFYNLDIGSRSCSFLNQKVLSICRRFQEFPKNS